MPMYNAREAAEYKGVAVKTVQRILWSDSRRRMVFPNAVKEGSKYRGEWRIPQTDLEAWNPNSVGRPSKPKPKK